MMKEEFFLIPQSERSMQDMYARVERIKEGVRFFEAEGGGPK